MNFSEKSVDITSAYQYMWSLCLDIWRWLDSVHIVLGPVYFTLFELMISVLAIMIIWEAIFKLVLAG